MPGRVDSGVKLGGEKERREGRGSCDFVRCDVGVRKL